MISAVLTGDCWFRFNFCVFLHLSINYGQSLYVRVSFCCATAGCKHGCWSHVVSVSKLICRVDTVHECFVKMAKNTAVVAMECE